MRFKLFKALIAVGMAACALVVMTSCSYFFGDKKENKNTYNLSLNEKTSVSCVSDNTDLLRDYFDMKRDDEQIAADLLEMKTCLKDAIALFVRHTRSTDDDTDTYTPADIHEFLSASFDNYSFGASFMDDVVRLKDSLIGGTPYKITKAEIQHLPTYIDFFYGALAELSKERRLLFSSEKNNIENWKKFPAAGNKFLKLVKGFQNLPRKSGGVFDYNNLVNVVMYFMEGEQIEHWTKTFELVNSLQALVTSGQRDQIQVSRLPFAVNNLAELYLIYIEFNQFLKDDYFYKDMSTLATFPGLISRVVKDPKAFDGIKPLVLNSAHQKCMNVLEAATASAPKGELSLDYLDDFIDTLKKIDSLPEYIKPETLKAMLPAFVSLWLSPKECTGQECELRFVKAEQMQVLRKMFDEWKDRQMWINSLNEKQIDISRGSRALKANLRANTGNINAFQEAIDKVNHMHWEDYLVVGVKKRTYKDLIIFNEIYTLVQIFTRPFNGNNKKPKLINYYLDKDQSLTFYQWFRPLGLELKLVDPRSSVTSTAAFTEINLFGSTADRPEELNFTEMIEYFEISISTSFRAVELIENKFIDCKLKPALIDVFGFEKRDALCFRNEWAKNYDEYLFKSLPRLQKYMSGLDHVEQKVLLNFLERASRQGLIVDEPVETDNLRQFSSITQYAESMFNRFDENEDNIITSNELKKAIAHIVPNITGILKSSLDPETANTIYKWFPKFEEDLITYIIVKQALPGVVTADTYAGGFSGLADIKMFKLWSDSKNEWLEKDARVNREDVILVISALSSLGRVTKIKNLKKHFFENELEFNKPLMGAHDPLLVPVAKELGCSQAIDAHLKQWLFDNHKGYWDDVLTYVETGNINIFGWEIGPIDFGANNVPETGAFHGWEGNVTYKLVEMVKNDPVLGPLCGVPYLENIHKISKQQNYHERVCMGRGCSDVYRQPY